MSTKVQQIFKTIKIHPISRKYQVIDSSSNPLAHPNSKKPWANTLDWISCGLHEISKFIISFLAKLSFSCIVYESHWKEETETDKTAVAAV